MRFRYLTPSLCTLKMMTVLEPFRKIHFRYLTPPPPKLTLAYKLNIWTFWKDNAFVTLLLPPPLHPKSDTCYLINRTCERFGKIPFRYLTLPPPPTATQNDTRYLVNRTSERFGKYAFFILPPLHPKNDTLYLIYRTSYNPILHGKNIRNL